MDDMEYVEFKFKDGSRRILKGRAAKNWDDDMIAMSIFAYNRGYRMHKYRWEDWDERKDVQDSKRRSKRQSIH